MKAQRYVFILCIGLVSVMSCVKGLDAPTTPSIRYDGVSKDTIQQGSATEDNFVLMLHIEDGDGDIGNDVGEFNLFITDSRTNADYDQPYKIPMVPEEISRKGVVIDMELTLFSTCCLYPDSTIPCEPSTEYPLDSLQLFIQLIDRAGNQSNIVTSDWLYLLCDG